MLRPENPKGECPTISSRPEAQTRGFAVAKSKSGNNQNTLALSLKCIVSFLLENPKI